MTRYLLDTNHASALWQNHPLLISRINASRNTEFFLALPSIAELWFMVHKSTRVAANEQSLRNFLQRLLHYDFEAEAAEQFGFLKAHLKRIGRPIPVVDLQIASIARSRNIIVLTADAHFALVPDLQHENWLT